MVPHPARKTEAPRLIRPLGTMVAYGFPRGDLGTDLGIASRLQARCLEILPDWSAEPDPVALRDRVGEAGLEVYSVHGCWGGRSIRAGRVDLSHLDPEVHRASIDDLKRCLDWARQVGGRCLVVHPGGLSDPQEWDARRAALARGLIALAEHAQGLDLPICVENMPPGVHPGSHMADLAGLVAELDRPELALALDTGHANLVATAASETLAAGPRLRTTHVHDNDGRQDTHLPPGLGTVDWDAWLQALDAIGYAGPIMLECIRHLRQVPEVLDEGLLARLQRLTRGAGER